MTWIIAVDFDGTLCSDDFPDCGIPNQALIDLLIHMRSCGNKVILWTCRGGKYLKEAIKWCKDYGLEFDAINEDISEVKKTIFENNKSVKIYANIYLDNKSENIYSFIKAWTQYYGL